MLTVEQFTLAVRDPAAFITNHNQLISMVDVDSLCRVERDRVGPGIVVRGLDAYLPAAWTDQAIITRVLGCDGIKGLVKGQNERCRLHMNAESLDFGDLRSVRRGGNRDGSGDDRGGCRCRDPGVREGLNQNGHSALADAKAFTSSVIAVVESPERMRRGIDCVSDPSVPTSAAETGPVERSIVTE